MLKFSVGVIFLRGFLALVQLSLVSTDTEPRGSDDGSESNIAFDSADLTAVVDAVTGEYQLEAYRSTGNDRILLELSEAQNSGNMRKISRLRWMSIGQPMFVKIPNVWNDSELFHESEDGFSTHIQMLTLEHRKELASVARHKYSLNITENQITNLVLSKFECKLEMLDQNGQKHLLTGIVTDFRHFPLQIDFDAPPRSPARELFLMQRRNINLKFRCGLGTKGKLTRTNTLSITGQQLQEFGLEDNLLGNASANKSKDVFVSRNQLSELANEMYTRLNILEEYEMPEHQFSDTFVQGLIEQITSSQFSQVPIGEALASLSKYGFDVSEDLRPDIIKRDLGSILKVDTIGNKSRIVVDKDVYRKLEHSNANKVLAKVGGSGFGISAEFETEVSSSNSLNRESKDKSLDDQLNELNTHSQNDMKWEFEGNRVVPKSLNVARLARSKFSKTLTFNRIRTQSHVSPFSRQFTIYTHRALQERPRPMYCANNFPMKKTEILVVTCPKPGAVNVVEFPPQCCSFPFTLRGQLHYGCVPGSHGHFECIVDKRIWATCAEPHDFVAQNQTVNVTIPVVARFTAIHVHNWIVFQQRIDGSVNFNRSWEEYKVGFGKHDGNFWMGLEKVHRMTNSASYKLRMEFRVRNGSWYSVEYDTFHVESEASKYKIRVTGYSGDVYDVMNHPGRWLINGMSFTTHDRDNDGYICCNCACERGGGWWYNSCFRINLNGQYGTYHFHVDDIGPCTASRMMMKNV